MIARVALAALAAVAVFAPAALACEGTHDMCPAMNSLAGNPEDVWNFDDPDADWPVLFDACGGMSQSPVNIAQAAVDPNLKPAEYSSNTCTDYSQFLNSYTFEVDFASYCTSLGIKMFDQEWTLLQFHLHSASEHTIGGGFFDAEVHFVHINYLTGNLLVIGVLLEVSETAANNTFLQPFWSRGLTTDETIITDGLAVNPYETFLPRSRGYHTYSGSLTTPPCSEVVTWVVMTEPVRISPYQMNKYNEAVRENIPETRTNNRLGNRRPTQPLNGRVITTFIDGLYTLTPEDPTPEDPAPVGNGGDVAVSVDSSEETESDDLARLLGILALVVSVLACLVICGLGGFLCASGSGRGPTKYHAPSMDGVQMGAPRVYGETKAAP